MNYVQVSNLDFNDIKTALKDYLRAQTDFTDFDFEGSAWANLIDVLAYNTYYTAFNTNMVVNELFLDSATLRDNVITLAKQLGYKPKSVVAPEAVVNFKVTFPGTAPRNIILKKGTGFITTFDDQLYRYVAVDDIKVPVSNNEAFFNNVSLFEGTLITNRYVVNKVDTSQKFMLSNANADTSTIRVKVFDTPTSSSFVYYNQIDTHVRRVFPDRFDDVSFEETAPQRQAGNVVAPAARSGKKPRKVQLTSTQVSLAKRLGLSNEQYAAQLMKDMK